MKVFIVLCLAAVAFAKPQLLLNNGLVSGGYPWGYNQLGYGYNGLGLRYAAAPVVAPAVLAPQVAVLPSSQYHAQNELGGYNYGYASADGQAKNEIRNLDGTVLGSYSYIDPEGKPIQVNYAADALGFRVVSNNLPVPPALPEANVRAIAEHEAARAKVLSGAPAAPQ